MAGAPKQPPKGDNAALAEATTAGTPPQTPPATSDAAVPPALEQFQQWTDLVGRGQQLLLEHWARQPETLPDPDPLGMMATWQRATAALFADPQRLFELQSRYVADAMTLWQSFVNPGSVERPVAVKAAADKDKRFAGEAWREAPAFDFLRQSYLLAADYFHRATSDLDGLDAHEQAKARFLVKQFVDAMSPSNFLATNPEVLKATAESGGANLLKGLEHLLADLEAGRMRMTDEDAFEVGRNIAVTPGQVVFENRLFQLIQYAPVTPKVAEIPLLIFPPWINKFYILDLTALDVVREICDVPAVNVIGYCVAGTALAATLAVLEARGRADEVRSATFFTAQVDMSECGDLGLFVDDAGLETIARLTADKPWLDGRNMAMTFNLLRSNDLIWNYVVNNYLLGKDYFPFDLLYWNSDATNVPALWHRSYLEDIYRDNLLVKPGGITVLGVPIDVRTITTPAYIQGGKEDHIAPARSAYKLTGSFAGEKRFVLAGSGHIAGVVNPPSLHKYQYWTNDTLPARFDDFVKTAHETKGSWWPDWIAWLKPRSGGQVPARVPGAGKYKAIEPAPGRYVKERI